ncbi:NIF family HAD-type phosphatase [Bdellovibrio sp. HCB337]|uniref:NIF family HAD-type phosphatase n=1 Tax=Bdellovibrio sp. HCB337 TaxID=3394358 RepID=UPI0039A68F21
MPIVRLILLFLGLFVLAPVWAKGPSLDVVFDLDWTLFYPSKTSPNSNSLSFGPDYYVMADGAAQVIAALHRDGHRVSLFSGGEDGRNQALAEYLLEKVKAQGVSDFAFYKVLSKKDLTPRPGAAPDARFSERYMKDLSKVNEDLSRVVLVDDMDKFAVRGQEKNMYFLGTTYAYHESFNPQMQGAYDPPNEAEWLRERRKIMTFYQAFKAASTQAVGDEFLPSLRALARGRPLCSKVFSN